MSQAKNVHNNWSKMQESVLKQIMPSYVTPPATTLVAPLKKGVGTEIRKLLKSWGVTDKAGCGCGAKAQEWDSKGIEWCKAHIDELVAFLIIQGRKRNWLLGVAASFTARKIVEAAIVNAEAIEAGGTQTGSDQT